MKLPPALRWFWRIYIPCAVLALGIVLASPFAGRVEQLLAPVMDNVRVVPGTLRRDAARLCYDWLSDKHREATLENIDVFLDRPATGDRSFPEVFNANTGVPWHRDGAYPIRPDNLHQQCIQLPPDLARGEQLVLHQTMWFRGWYGLWLVPIMLPDIKSPPAPP